MVKIYIPHKTNNLFELTKKFKFGTKKAGALTPADAYLIKVIAYDLKKGICETHV
jgi:hypothetical protein